MFWESLVLLGFFGCVKIYSATGPTGPATAIAATIPFSIGQYGSPFYTDEQGNPLIVNFLGFGGQYYAPVDLQPGEWATGTINFLDNVAYGNAFIMPYNGTLRNIHALFSTAGGVSFEPGVTIRPFVCLATSNAANLVYTILQNTITFTEPYIGGIGYAKHTLRRGSLVNLDVAIPEGTLVAIVAGIMSDGAAEEQSASLSVSGGLFLE